MKKIYLKDLTPEEIIKRLRKGDVIKNKYRDDILYMVDGVILSKDLKGIITVCPCFEISEQSESVYFEEEEAFEITETGVYRTREGKRAYVYEIDESVCYSFSVCYILEREGKPRSVTKQGQYCTFRESPYDIVAKWGI